MAMLATTQDIKCISKWLEGLFGWDFAKYFYFQRVENQPMVKPKASFEKQLLFLLG